MKKIKVVTVVGTRPELIRLSRVIDLLDKNIDHVLVHTGQNFDYELNKIFFADLNTFNIPAATPIIKKQIINNGLVPNQLSKRNPIVDPMITAATSSVLIFNAFPKNDASEPLFSPQFFLKPQMKDLDQTKNLFQLMLLQHLSYLLQGRHPKEYFF